jgi:hypothetical protein
MFALWLAPLALASELSLSGKVVAINRDHISDQYFIKVQGLSLQLKSPKGEVYQCLRKGLNSQNVLTFTFDPQTLKISDCQDLSV